MTRPGPRRRSLASLLVIVGLGGLAVVGARSARAVPSPSGSAGTIQTMGGATVNFKQGGYGPEGVLATSSQFSIPRGLNFAPNGDLYVSDALNHVVRRIDANGTVSLAAGTAPTPTSGGSDLHPGETGDGGPATAALLDEPHGVAVGSNGTLYIADSRNCVIRKVDSNGVITRFAGTGERKNGAPDPLTCAHSPVDPPSVSNPLTVALDQPKSLFMTKSGNTDQLWVADMGNSMLRRIDIVNGVAENMVRIAGVRQPSFFADGSASAAALRHAEGIWVAADGTIYFTDGGNNLVRKIKNGVVSTIAGDVAAAEASKANTDDLAGNDDGDGGPASAAHLDQPRGITGDNQGNLYVAEEHGSRIRRINLNTGVIDTIAGDGTVAEQRANPGSAAIKGENGPALQTQFNHLRDIQINPADGSLWIADSRDNRVRAVADPASAPGAVAIIVGPPTTTTSSTTTSSTSTSSTSTTTTTTVPGLPTTTTTTTAPATPPATTTTGTVSGAASRSGYWMVGSDGVVYGFGAARNLGNAAVGSASAVDLEPTPSGNGYWVVDDLGRVRPFGDAVAYGDVDRAKLAAGEKATSLSATADGGGYWIFTNRGRVLNFGNAAFLGDVSTMTLAGPVLDSITTPSGQGYYMVASDGGIFAFGDAKFYGSMGGQHLNAPVQSLVPDADGVGYWLVSSDGGIFAFQADFHGSMGASKLNKPVTGMVRAGHGYLMVGEDGGIFNFSGDPNSFQGSLGAHPPAKPITSVAVLEVR